MTPRRPSQKLLMRLGQPKALVIFVISLGIAMTALAWLGFRATEAWRASIGQLVERRASEKMALLAAALNHDMKGAVVKVLVPLTQDHLAFDTPYDLSARFAKAFARFPYPESFFVWRIAPPGEGTTYAFNRADRPPPWAPARVVTARYPVVIMKDAEGLRGVIARIREHAVHRTRFLVFDTTVAGESYQIVVHMLDQGSPSGIYGVVGFTVNLDWVRRQYFDELTRQISSIGDERGEGDDLALAIVDDQGVLVAATAPMDRTPGWARTFPLLFFDPALLPRPASDQPRIAYWTAHVGTSGEGAVTAAAGGADRLIALIALAALGTLAALLVTARAVRMNAQLAAMKSEFVSAVTHELKTPLSSIRLVADTLSGGRYDSATTVRDYARLLARESASLGLLIDNLLTYARINDVDGFYSFTLVDVHELIDDAVKRSHARLTELGFTISVDIATELPPLRADRAAVLHAIDNLIDNAIKYSNGTRVLMLSGHQIDRLVHIEVTDRGPGIPVEERARVFEKFYRGMTVRTGGSGLGLTIVERVVRDHGGTVAIRDGPGGGTIVDIALPVATGEP